MANDDNDDVLLIVGYLGRKNTGDKTHSLTKRFNYFPEGVRVISFSITAHQLERYDYDNWRRVVRRQNGRAAGKNAIETLSKFHKHQFSTVDLRTR